MWVSPAPLRVDGRLREAGDVRRLARHVHRTTLGPVADDGHGLPAHERGERAGLCHDLARPTSTVHGQASAASRSVASSALLVHTSVCASIVSRTSARQRRERGPGVEHDDHLGGSLASHSSSGARVCVEDEREAGDAHQVACARRGRGERLDGDVALGAQGGDERAFGGRLDEHHADPGVLVGDRRRGDRDPLRRERGPYDVTVRPGAVGAGMHAVGAEPRGGDAAPSPRPRRSRWRWSAITFWPRAGRSGTSRTTSTSAWPVWITRRPTRERARDERAGCEATEGSVTRRPRTRAPRRWWPG